MTKAQAAAARHEETANSIAKKKAQEDNQYMKEVRRRAQKQASGTVIFRFLVPFVIILAIVVFAILFTVGPGMVVGH